MKKLLTIIFFLAVSNVYAAITMPYSLDPKDYQLTIDNLTTACTCTIFLKNADDHLCKFEPHQLIISNAKERIFIYKSKNGLLFVLQASQLLDSFSILRIEHIKK